MDSGLFDMDEPRDQERESAALMTSVQRQMLRELFAQIGVSEARDQFRIVSELTGVSITAVTELEVAPANVLIRQLKARVASMHRSSSGNAWADRDEDTWLDRL